MYWLSPCAKTSEGVSVGCRAGALEGRPGADGSRLGDWQGCIVGFVLGIAYCVSGGVSDGIVDGAVW